MLLAVSTVGALAAFGCAQVLGVDGQLALRSDGTSPKDAGSEVVVIYDAGDVFVPLPEAGDPNACPAGQLRCAGVCVSKKDPKYGCGASDCKPCSIANVAALACSDDGHCLASTCKTGYSACNQPENGCAFDLTNKETCGTCLNNCAVGTVCNAGFCDTQCPVETTECNGSCVDTKSSANNCGGCGIKCPTATNGDAVCIGGDCAIACHTGYAHCDGNKKGACAFEPPWFKDNDGDGFGDVAQSKNACTADLAGPGFVATPGDCFDGDKNVFPGQAAYFPLPYRNVKGETTYDYNCDGVETDRPGTPHFSTCNKDCVGNGYGPAGSGRVGPGVNDYCGSRTAYNCTTGGEVVPTSSPIHPMQSSSGAQLPVCGIQVLDAPPDGCH